MAETGVRIGMRNLVYAKQLTDDPATGATYDAPAPISKSISGTITPTTNRAVLYADDGASDTATALGDIGVSLNVRDLPMDVQAALLGHTVNSEGVLVKKSTDQAPYVAIGFKSLKSNGKYRYVWLYKGKFSPQEESYQTKGDSPEFQTPTIEATFIKRDADEAWQVTGDEDSETFTGGATWFDDVYEESAV